jgi:hypothetical protein
MTWLAIPAAALLFLPILLRLIRLARARRYARKLEWQKGYNHGVAGTQPETPSAAYKRGYLTGSQDRTTSTP